MIAHSKLSQAATVVGAVAMLLMANGIAQAVNGSAVYAYDALGRVASVSYDTGVIIIYSYDANGNRTSQTINANSTNAVWNSFTWGAALWHP